MALISLIISAAALAGVLVSLVYQSRQTRISQEASIRETHRELLMLSLNDPVLRACWGSPSNELPNDQARQVMFANLIVNWWQTQYVLKEVSEAELAISLTTFFRGEIGRTYWNRVRPSWGRVAEAAHSKRKKRFVAIVDEQYRLAVSGSG
ncbi:DUF6082 family protein [Streptomyces venezuelae]|uniref:Uncharacterized protein n=1 Tax=Streptomyces venezuelae TaxID=54571 RepID=A0A5P2C7X5_STRVZ|nr:DUF6082 family protein [Streptomyces venezuelae]QES38673.1 hypothetical protein DEJ48_39505 [Streptomyces venezuelae]